MRCSSGDRCAEAPNSKLQAPKKFQAPRMVGRRSPSALAPIATDARRAWRALPYRPGVWDLELLIVLPPARFSSKIPSLWNFALTMNPDPQTTAVRPSAKGRSGDAAFTEADAWRDVGAGWQPLFGNFRGL